MGTFSENRNPDNQQRSSGAPPRHRQVAAATTARRGVATRRRHLKTKTLNPNTLPNSKQILENRISDDQRSGPKTGGPPQTC